jgi:hypothetical protein
MPELSTYKLAVQLQIDLLDVHCVDAGPSVRSRILSALCHLEAAVDSLAERQPRQPELAVAVDGTVQNAFDDLEPARR